MHIDLQSVIVFILVAVSAWYVLRNVAAQIRGFGKTAKPGAAGCGGCEGSKQPPLIKLSVAAPRRVDSAGTGDKEYARIQGRNNGE